MKFILKLIGFFTGKRVIELFSAVDEDVRYTLLDPKELEEDGNALVYVYPIVGVGTVFCLPQGRVDPYSPSCYIKGWKYV